MQLSSKMLSIALYTVSILFLLNPFLAGATKDDPGQRCPADAVVVLDESSGITPSDFQNVIKPFLTNLALNLSISEEDTHFSLVHYSDTDLTGVDFYLTDNYDPVSISQKIGKMNMGSGNAALYTALDMVYSNVLTASRGARVDQWGSSVAAYVILITAGAVVCVQSKVLLTLCMTDSGNGNPSTVAYNLLESGVEIYAVGIGPLVTDDFLGSLTYDDSRMYHLNSPDDVSPLISSIIADTNCPIESSTPTPLPPPAYCDAIELIYVLDESVSVNAQDANNFDTVKKFMINLNNILTINQFANSRVSAVGYGRQSQLFFNLDQAKDNADLHNRVITMSYLGGERNPGAAFQTALDNVLPKARPAAPVYLIHVSGYAHDVGSDPATMAKRLGDKEVVILAAQVLSFRNDAAFQNETQRIVASGAPGSAVFTANTYGDLVNSGIREHLRDIVTEQFPCSDGNRRGKIH